eukprot:m.45678 g.45678  ORF g.45678 m.45678 type:complete len:238 (+) comp10688_c0_seq3:250-963(+)
MFGRTTSTTNDNRTTTIVFPSSTSNPQYSGSDFSLEPETQSSAEKLWGLSEGVKETFVSLMKGLADVVPAIQRTCEEMRGNGFVDACNILEARVNSQQLTIDIMCYSSLSSICTELLETEEEAFAQTCDEFNFMLPRNTCASPFPTEQARERDKREIQETSVTILHFLNAFLQERSKEIKRAYLFGFEEALGVALKWAHATGNEVHCGLLIFNKRIYLFTIYSALFPVLCASMLLNE